MLKEEPKDCLTAKLGLQKFQIIIVLKKTLGGGNLDLSHLSMRESLMSEAMALGCASPSLKTLSITDNSVLVVSKPQNAVQSFTTIPAAITSLPLFTVPACKRNTCLDAMFLFC